jgi:hypothetical protein
MIEAVRRRKVKELYRRRKRLSARNNKASRGLLS